MKQKKSIAAILMAVTVLAGIGLAGCSQPHEHSFGEWNTQTAAACETPEIEVRTCECGEEETREGDPATGHTYTSITAVSNLEKPMAGMAVEASDLSVTAACVCGENFAVTEGIELENATLALGQNTVTVRYGELSTTLTIEAAELDIALDGTVTDDTHISSGSKDKANSGKEEMGTKSDLFRVYFRTNISEILGSELFEANRDNAKVQLILSVTGGSITDKTTFTLKAYAPAAGVTDVDFSKLTWNSVNNKDGAVGEYSQLHWSSGTKLVSGGVGHNVQTDGEHILVTLAYSQIADFVDENGNIVFAFATNTDDLKIGSLENKTETNRPVIKVVLNDEHFHVFDQEVAKSEYFVSANCKEKTQYYVSCSCGAAGTETFGYGAVISHSYSSLIPKVEKTCTTDGMRAHYRCNVCHKYFVETDGQLKATSANSLIIPADHTYKVIAAKDATCTASGNYKYYKCDGCGAYFDADKNETTKEAQKIPALGHTFSELVEQKDATCTEDGMKEHYRCTVCEKYFVEKDGELTAVNVDSLKISAGHTYKVIAAKAATCTKDGNYKYYKCDGCGTYFDADKNETTKEAQKIDALGHTYGELVEQKDATCTEDGMKAHYYCSACGTYFDENKTETTEEDLKIPAGHDTKVIAAKAATCTKTGNNKYYQCKVCSKYFVDKEGTVETTKEAQKIDALGHTYEDGVCKVCGVEEP